ncbi:MAG TPA: AMP-binding protein [Solirubrobacteraceae bacterium]|nr:AMP-binding protein [Solirubrobacteraceae bacterium]
MQVEGWLRRAARSAPTVTALQTPDARLSYAELWRRACASASELAQRGARPQERVAIALPPGIAFAQALHACFLLGAVAVPVDLRLTAAERERIVAGASVLVEEPLRAESPRVEPLHAESPHVEPLHAESLHVEPLRAEPLDSSEPEAFAAGAVHDLDAVCAVIHTSGTTSAPRPVELTYGNFLWSALGSAVALGVAPDERWLCALPLSHVGGLSILVRSAIYAKTAVVHERFRTGSVLAALREQQITLVSLVSTTLARLLDAGLRDPPRLRCALTGGGPVPAALVERAREVGVPVVATYGLTEACSQAATAPLAMAAGAPRDVGAGVPLFCTRTEIARTGIAAPAGACPGDPAVGEIVLSGPTVARSALSADGRLHTGDLGRLDEHGFLHVSGRASDTIVSGGENVAPSEVEAVLEACPGVLEAAVVGREDAQWGEAVTAIVVVAPGASVGESVLREHCASRLAPFKVPKRVELVSSPLPRTRSGKLLRREL